MDYTTLEQRPRLKAFATAFLAVGLLAVTGLLMLFGTRAERENQQRTHQLESRPVKMLEATLGSYQQLNNLRIEVDGVSYHCYGDSRGGIHCTKDKRSAS